MQSGLYVKLYGKEDAVEELYVVDVTGGPYSYVRWYIEDPNPEADRYPTQLGLYPKVRIEHEGKIYMKTDTWKIPKN